MLEWLEVRLNVGYDKRLLYEYRIEPLKCDRDALKQECRLASIACSSTQLSTHLSEKIHPESTIVEYAYGSYYYYYY